MTTFGRTDPEDKEATTQARIKRQSHMSAVYGFVVVVFIRVRGAATHRRSKLRRPPYPTSGEYLQHPVGVPERNVYYFVFPLHEVRKVTPLESKLLGVPLRNLVGTGCCSIGSRCGHRNGLERLPILSARKGGGLKNRHGVLAARHGEDLRSGRVGGPHPVFMVPMAVP